MIIKPKYFPPLFIAAAAAASIAAAPIAAADANLSPGYLHDPGYSDASSPGADPMVPPGTQFMH
jgi:hypothetical protein